MNIYIFSAFILILSSAGIYVGIKMIKTGFSKRNGVELPEKNYFPLMPNLKQGQEWIVGIIGVVWTLVMFALFIAGIAALIE